MPVGVEQWRVAVGVMANAVAAKPQSPIGLRWKKWLRASDPVVYKGCVVLLVTIAQLAWSGVEQCKEKMKEGSECVCQSASRGKTRVLAMRARPNAVLVTSFLSQLLILLCGHILQFHCHDCSTTVTDQWTPIPMSEEQVGSNCVWTRFDPVQGGLMILLLPLTRVALTMKQSWDRWQFKGVSEHQIESDPNEHCFTLKALKEQNLMKSLPVHVYLVFQYLCTSLSLLKRCIYSSASLVYRKCNKKTISEGVASLMSLLFSINWRSGVRMVTMIVFVNQMLLMRAGDVERNPGPVTLVPEDLREVRSAIYSVRDKWYDIGLELNISFRTLNVIKTDCPQNSADCLREMLVEWLSRTSPAPSWSSLVEALSSEPVGEKRLAKKIHANYCVTQDQTTNTSTECATAAVAASSASYPCTTSGSSFSVSTILPRISEEVSVSVDFLSKLLSRDAVTMYRWLYGSQNLPLLRRILGSEERELSLPYSAIPPDYFAAGYCLAHSNCTWKINCNYISIDDVAMDFLSRGCKYELTATNIFSKIVSASFRGGSITADGVKHFLTIPNIMLLRLQHINLWNNKLDKRACEMLAEGVQSMSCLETLNLGRNLFGSGGAVQLVSSLRLHRSKLRELHMYITGISDPDFECIANYIRSSTSLERLYIGGNDMSVKSIGSLCKALSVNSSMKNLGIGGHNLTTSHCVCLGQLLREPIECKIEELILKGCNMTSDGVREVVSGLSDNHTLKELDLNDNQIGSEGAVAMATMLKENSLLETLRLNWCSIGSRGGTELGVALETNKTLKVLGLSGNAIGVDGVRGLCVGLENNSSLEELDLGYDVSLEEKGVSLLLKCVEEKNRSLKKLDLPKKYRNSTDLSTMQQSRYRCLVMWA